MLAYPGDKDRNILLTGDFALRPLFARALFGYADSDLPCLVSFGAKRFNADAAPTDKVDDAYLAKIVPLIQRMPSIDTLDLSETDVTGEGCRALAGLPQLRQAILDDTAIDDDDIAPLASLQQLESLSLRGTRLSLEGLQELQRRLPNCDIDHDLKLIEIPAIP